MYTITSSVFIHFGHHVRGHDGPCISLHGHTWKFEIAIETEDLDAHGFVVDFDRVQASVLQPCHDLLDHGLALGIDTWQETREQFVTLGETLVGSRRALLGDLGEPQPGLEGELCGARNERPGGIKVAVFPFTPTSERLARWLYDVGAALLRDQSSARVACARVYETLHPSDMVAEYRPSPAR